jgi:hypothetical protein
MQGQTRLSTIAKVESDPAFLASTQALGLMRRLRRANRPACGKSSITRSSASIGKTPTAPCASAALPRLHRRRLSGTDRNPMQS